jgi:hypothetical protein
MGRPQVSPGGGGGGLSMPTDRSQMSPSGSGRGLLSPPIGSSSAGRSLMPSGGAGGLMSPNASGRQMAASCRDPLSPDRSQLGSPDKELMPSKAKKKSVRKGISVFYFLFSF